jgi:transposase InsO family protein
MPWQGVSTVDARLAFVTEYLTGTVTMTELAAAYRVSRPTGYYWVRAYQREGPGRLAGASRRPHRMARATPPEVVKAVLEARDHHPHWGASKLRAWLQRQAPEQTWPCRDTVHQLLRRAGKVRQRRHRRAVLAPPAQLHVPTAPNVVWTVDFKGEFRTGDGRLCYPFTLRDGYSRFVLRCTALPSVRGAHTRPQLLRAFADYGLPERIRSDNGPPFGQPTSLARLSRLAVWWLRLGVWPERITPGRPGQNGAHEQFHRVLKRETACPPAGSHGAQQRRFAAFVREYNYDRPHEALHQEPPATRYTPSPRPLPPRVPPPEYPAAWDVRRVRSSGEIKWAGRCLFLTHVLAGEDVALEPIDDGVWLVRFAALPLAVFHERGWVLRRPQEGSPLAQDPGS